MSSEGMLIVPRVVVAAAGSAAVLTAAAAAVLAIGAASAATESAVRAPGEADGLSESRGADSAPGWQAVVARVVELNARIRMLAERTSRVGVRIDVPEALGLEGRAATEAAAWCDRSALLLAAAQQELCAATAADESRRLSVRLARSVAADPEIAAVFAGLQETLRGRFTAPTARSAEADTDAEASAILCTLDPDANETEHLDVLSTAADAVRDDRRETAASHGGLRAKVASVNARVARRRLAAQWLTALEEPLVAGIELPGPFLGMTARLRAVVAGDDDLDPQLRAEGAEAVEWAAQAARLHFVRALLRSGLTDRGYTVESESDELHDAELRLTRPDWHGEHSAEVWVDRHGALHGRMIREHDHEGTAAVHDRARRAGFNADIVALGRSLGADVVVDGGYVPQHRNRAHVRRTGPAATAATSEERP